MTKKPASETPVATLLVRGVHLKLTNALAQAVREKTLPLRRHEERLTRIRIVLEFDQTRNRQSQFIARGRLELPGPDLFAHVTSVDAYRSLDQLVDKLDERLRRRHQKRVNIRNDPRAP